MSLFPIKWNNVLGERERDRSSSVLTAEVAYTLMYAWSFMCMCKKYTYIQPKPNHKTSKYV